MTEEAPCRVSCTVDLDGDGVQHGYFAAPCSHDESAWGSVRTAITVVTGVRPGPTVLFTGGNHGDEYEGPIALMDLARTLEPRSLAGKAIIVPCLNAPAVDVGRRTSPVDGGNMNRSFPGRWDGNVTQMTADFVNRFLISRADAVVDIHSGGRTLMMEPFAAIHELPDTDQYERCLAAMKAFGAPLGLVLNELDAKGMLDTTAEEAGKTFVTTELGGGGTATPQTVGIARRGVMNLLKHFGMIRGQPERTETRLLHMPDSACYIAADDDGVLELLVDLGARVNDGTEVARIYNHRRPHAKPAVYTARRDGVLIGRHHSGRIRPGDCLATLGVPMDG